MMPISRRSACPGRDRPTARRLWLGDAERGRRVPSMCEPRPYRGLRSANDAAAELPADVRAARLESREVEPVLAAAGDGVVRRREGPAGLTARGVEVLRLL